MKSILLGRVLPAVAISVTFGALIAHAQGRPKVDTNGDGLVDFGELQVVRPDLTPAEFNAMDQNADGQLVREEMFAAHMAERMKRIDSDGDGAISFEEMEEFHARPSSDRFRKFDTDGDGKLTQEEMKAMHEAMAGHMPALVRFRHAPDDADAQTEK